MTYCADRSMAYEAILCYGSFNLVTSLDVAVILPLHLVGMAELSSLRLVGAD